MRVDRAVHRTKLIVPMLALALAACDDPYGPGFWVATPDTMVMYSASRVEYIGFRSALNIANDPVTALPIEAPGLTGNWDVALTDHAGGLALVPAAAFDGVASRARIAVMPAGVGFAEVEQAPRDTTAYTAEAVSLQEQRVYVIRSRRASCGFSSGYRYAKVMPVDVDAVAGTLRFIIVRNPYCDDRSFVPPDL
jgi:hypothetical protein